MMVDESQPVHPGGTAETPTHILLVGPLPPPLTGTPISFEIFAEESMRLVGEDVVSIVDTSPKRLKQQLTTVTNLFRLSNLRQALRVIVGVARNLRQADVMIVFASNGHLVSLGPVLLLLARISRTPCHLRVFGGSLDRFIESKPPAVRRLADATLKRYAGVIVQTELLRAHFAEQLGTDRVHLVPGYRKPLTEEADPAPVHRTGSSDVLRLVFVGIIKETKGVLVLLEALSQLQAAGTKVACDFFGTLHEPVRATFFEEVDHLERVSYRGELDWRDVVSTMATYDALVLPTFFDGEGHPGVIIEAKLAGIAVVSTDHRSIPELVTDGFDGLLVTPGSSEALATALVRLLGDPALVDSLGRASARSGLTHTSEAGARQILGAVGVATASTPSRRPTS